MSYSLTAGDVKSLRDRTGAGMHEAKNALIKAEGDPFLAEGILKYKGCSIYVRGMTHEEWYMMRAHQWAEELRNATD